MNKLKNEMNETKKGVVPKLRFPEFRGSGEWEIKTLGQLGMFVRGLTYGSSDVANSGLLVLRSSNIQDGQLVLDNDLVFVSKQCPTELSLKPGDIVICMSNGSKALVGKNAEFLGNYDLPITIGAFCSFYRPKNSFVKFIFQTERYQKFVAFSIGGGNINNLKNSDLEVYIGAIPATVLEQSRIADCLSSLDSLIAAHSQKLDGLKSYKKGLMQQLFPAKGEKIPKLRFPEFRKSGEWEEKTFGGISTFYNGRAYKQEELLESGKYRVLRVGNFFTNNNWYYSDLELEDNKYCDKGDLLYAWSASFGPRIWNEEKVIYHYHIWKVVENMDVCKEFLFILLDYETERMKATSANGLGMMHITKGSIESWKCFIPKFNEQQRIAYFLSSIDNLITAESQKIESLKTHKKGLMQQLFPAMDEANA